MQYGYVIYEMSIRNSERVARSASELPSRMVRESREKQDLCSRHLSVVQKLSGIPIPNSNPNSNEPITAVP